MRPAGRSLVLALFLAAACSPAKLGGTPLNEIEAPDFTLTDGLSAKPVQLSALRGQVVALTFLYTRCPDVCPLTASRFKSAQDELASDAGKIAFVAVSIDPDGDTPQAVQRFSELHGLSRSWFYLIGGRAQLAPVWAAYGIGVQPSSTIVAHNDAIYLIDKRGRERTLLHSDVLASDLARDLRALARE